jgi:septation ring formation regulator EzrA
MKPKKKTPFNRNKPQINATVPLWVKEKAIELGQSSKYTNTSEVVTRALINLFQLHDADKYLEVMPEFLVQHLLRIPGGLEVLEATYKAMVKNNNPGDEFEDLEKRRN